LIPPDQLYEVCDEDAVDADVEGEPKSDGSADAAHGAAANPVPDPQSGAPPAGSRDICPAPPFNAIREMDNHGVRAAMFSALKATRDRGRELATGAKAKP